MCLMHAVMLMQDLIQQNLTDILVILHDINDINDILRSTVLKRLINLELGFQSQQKNDP